MAKVKVSEKAILLKLANIIQNQQQKKQIKAIYKRFEDLEQQPLRGRPIPELQDENIRHVEAGSYRIIYHVIAEYGWFYVFFTINVILILMMI